MNDEVAQQTGVPMYTRSKRAHWNRYRILSLKTRFGEINLRKSQIYEILLGTKVFEQYSAVEKAAMNAIIEFYLQGMLTRTVKNEFLTMAPTKFQDYMP